MYTDIPKEKKVVVKPLPPMRIIRLYSEPQSLRTRLKNGIEVLLHFIFLNWKKLLWFLFELICLQVRQYFPLSGYSVTATVLREILDPAERVFLYTLYLGAVYYFLILSHYESVSIILPCYFEIILASVLLISSTITTFTNTYRLYSCSTSESKYYKQIRGLNYSMLEGFHVTYNLLGSLLTVLLMSLVGPPSLWLKYGLYSLCVVRTIALGLQFWFGYHQSFDLTLNYHDEGDGSLWINSQGEGSDFNAVYAHLKSDGRFSEKFLKKLRSRIRKYRRSKKRQ